MNTQLLFCKKVNKELVNLGKYFVDFNFRGSGLTGKYRENWTTRKFPILRLFKLLIVFIVNFLIARALINPISLPPA